MKIYEGLKVLEIADIKGMLCGKMLAGMGADVLKIERPGGDVARQRGPFAKGAKEDNESSLSFAYFNTDKKDITLDIFSEEGREIFIKLVKDSDVLIETFTPGKLASANLSYEDLSEINPGLIMLSISPFGQSGPYAYWKASSDLIPDALSGLMSTVGYYGQAPLHFGYDVQSCAVSMYGLFGIQAAYHNRLYTNRGTHIDVSMQDCISNWTSQGLGLPQVAGQDIPRKNLSGGGIKQGLVNCKDGLAHLTIGTKWHELLQWFSDMNVDITRFEDPKYEEYAKEMLTPWDQNVFDAANELASKYTAVEFMEEGQSRKLPTAAIIKPSGMLANTHLKERGFFTDIEHPHIGKYQYPGAPIMFGKSPIEYKKPAPRLGQDNEEVFHGLGMSDKEISNLKEKGVM